MQYLSTRGDASCIDFEQVATRGLASDGGLYVPSHWPRMSESEIRDLKDLTYTELAVRIIGKFAGDSVPDEALRQVVSVAYGEFDHPEVAPFSELRPGLGILELFHGPTLSFKDYALQFLGRFMDWSLRTRGARLAIVGATSGDTGSAAIYAVRGLETIDLYMLHPDARVSPMQRLQMTTSDHPNIHNLAVAGTFDDCQAMVKQIFSDPEMKRRVSLGAVNSINWGRIAAQVVYYFYAAARLGAPEKQVTFSVPTGNFGNVFAGYAAAAMGLPIAKMVVCSNENDILTRFFETGTMQKQSVRTTLSPSMDIQVSSNFERFLFELLDRDGNAVKAKMEQFATTGTFSVSDDALKRAREHFIAHRVSNDETCKTIAAQYAESGLIVDPHTAIALACAKKMHDPESGPVVVISTAHPAKFAETIAASIGRDIEIPHALAALRDRQEHYGKIAANADELKRHILAS